MKYAYGLLLSVFSLFVLSELEEITVINSKWLFLPSVDQIEEEEIYFLNSHHLKELLNLSSGVWISRGSGQENLISLRSPVLTGSGACGSFQITEDGIPIRPAGFCNVNNLFEISANLASQVEVIKGPSSAMFGGNSLHGLINIKSLEPKDTNDIYLQIDKNESLRSRVLLRNSSNTLLGVELDRDKGFRNQTGFDQQKMVIKNYGSFRDWSLQTLINFTNLNQETAGYIDSYLYPTKIINVNPEAYRDAKSLRIKTEISKNLDALDISLIPYIRFSSMNFIQHYLPGQPIEKNGQKSAGLFFNLLGFKVNNNSFGIGSQIEFAHVNLDQYQPDVLNSSNTFNNAVRPQGFHYDFEVKTNLIASYISHEFESKNSLKFFSNFRVEYLKYDYDNLMSDGRLRDDGSACERGGCFYSRPADSKLSFKDLSHRIGISKEIDSGKVFVQFSKGHRPPQINELFRLQKSQTLADLDSEKINSFEIAIENLGKNYSNKLVFYYSKKKNYIFKDADTNMVVGGKSRHKGIEIKGLRNFNTIFSIKYALNIAGHYYDFTDINRGIILGNEIDTAPNVFGSIFLNFKFINKIILEIEQEFMDEYFTEPSNIHSYKGHYLTNLRTSYDLNRDVSFNLSVLNLFDKEYAERADFSSFSGERFFPGIPLKWRLGINYKFN